MGYVKTSITIPDDIFSEAKKVSNNFSALVTEAVKEYLRRKNVKKAVASFGGWKDRVGSSAEIVAKLREKSKRHKIG